MPFQKDEFISTKKTPSSDVEMWVIHNAEPSGSSNRALIFQELTLWGRHVLFAPHRSRGEELSTHVYIDTLTSDCVVLKEGETHETDLSALEPPP